MTIRSQNSIISMNEENRFEVSLYIYNSCSKCRPSASIHASICRCNDCCTRRSKTPVISATLAEASTALPMKSSLNWTGASQTRLFKHILKSKNLAALWQKIFAARRWG